MKPAGLKTGSSLLVQLPLDKDDLYWDVYDTLLIYAVDLQEGLRLGL